MLTSSIYDQLVAKVRAAKPNKKRGIERYSYARQCAIRAFPKPYSQAYKQWDNRYYVDWDKHWAAVKAESEEIK